ncbi:hypothetical protein MYX84_08775 [Acidobacteria bacterium AH-259-O06]|nr:hypothetical protein [Acidobacteria bacterium AH-259-O06]
MSCKSFSVFIFLALALCLATPTVTAQDPTEVDPDHYKVEFENDQVRVLRIIYGPQHKSVMHEHPAAVAIFLTDVYLRITLPDGTTEGRTNKARDVVSRSATKHLPQNLSNRPFQVILVELKGKNR